MINLINRGREDTANITIFNVDFKSNEENIKDNYQEVKFRSIQSPKPGVFILEFDKENALKFIEIGTKVIFPLYDLSKFFLFPLSDLLLTFFNRHSMEENSL